MNAKTRSLVQAGLGVGSVLFGRKVVGLSMFGKGLWNLEKEWRKEHPEFRGGFAERWQRAIEFYEDTHKDPVNRKLHIIGIPMILGGTAGLLLFRPFRPLWLLSMTSFTAGWVLNFIGHGVYEKKAPAFADDPLSFVAGPVWDFQQLFGNKAKVETVETPHGTITIINVPIAAQA
jgi:hypothetical protein